MAVDGQKIRYGQYDAVQTKKAYQILYNPGQPDKYPYGIYINRIRSGKIDLYEYQPLKSNNDKNKKLPYHVYVFKKNKGEAVVLDFATFTDALTDNQAALDKFKQLFPLGSTIPENDIASTLIKLTAVTDLYNGTNTDSSQASR